MKKTFLHLSLGLLSIAATSFAGTVITLGGVDPANNTGLHSSYLGAGGATEVTFDVAIPATVTYSDTDAGTITTGSVSGQCATPPGDTSAFYCVGPNRGTPNTLTFSSAINYFGFYVGSLDNYNFVTLKSGATTVLTLTGTDIATRAGIPANGNQSLGYYVNIFGSLGTTFDSIVLDSTQNALETDNHAFGTVRDIPTVDGQVPEPGTLLTLIPAAAFR